MPRTEPRTLPRTPSELLISLRWLAIAGQLLTILVVHGGFGMRLPLGPLAVILALQAGFNLAVIRFRPPVGDFRPDLLALQFTADILALAMMLFFTGGAFNPFVSLFLVPLAISAVLLPTAYTCALVVLTVFLYGNLLGNSVPLPEPPPGLASRLSLHLVGMWVNFIISACLIAGFVTHLSSRLRASQQALRTEREQNLRQEQILALGTLAAGTAHELGTPLATMAVVMSDLEHDVPEPLKPEVRLVLQQIGICKDKLSQLVRDVREGGNRPVRQTLAATARKAVSQFSLLRPQVPLVLETGDGATECRIRVDRALEQALLNLLDNAAEASPREVLLSVGREGGRAVFRIADRGPGFPEALLAAAGQRILDGSGMGIGLLLSNATVERHGGEVRVQPREGGGSVVLMSLPLEENVDEP